MSATYSQEELTTIGNRARNAAWATFGIMGLVSMGWVARVPEIKDIVNLNNGQFGLVLVSGTIGALFGAQLSGRLIHTFGSRRVISVAIFVMPLGLIGIGLAQTTPYLVFSLFVMGFGYSSMDISVNTQAAVIEKIVKRRWMSTFHALWSVGAFSAALLGGAIAHFISPKTHLVALGIICMLAYIPGAIFLLPPDLDEHDGGEEETEAKIPLFSTSVLPLWGMGIAMLSGLVAEGAASDWGGILLRDSMGIDKGKNATAFGCFALAMITSRFLGDKMLHHFGPLRTVKIGGYLGGIGWGIGVLIAVPLSDSHQLLSLIIVDLGFALAGFGLGPMFPAIILAASQTPGIASSVAMARVGVIGMMGFFIGPTITGGLAELFTLPVAILFPAFCLTFAGYMSRSLRNAR